MNTPPAHALAARGITVNVHGFMLYGNYQRSNPPAAIVDAVADGAVDVALVWGPVAGFFAAARRSRCALNRCSRSPTAWPMTYAISVGVRRDEPQLLERINASLAVERAAIKQLLRQYRVPAPSTTSY